MKNKQIIKIARLLIIPILSLILLFAASAFNSNVELIYKDKLETYGGLDSIMTDIDNMVKYSESISEMEYNRLRDIGIPDIQFYKYNDLVAYSEDYLDHTELNNKYQNIYSCKNAIITYVILAKVYGKHYFRDTVIVQDDELELQYYEKIVDIMQDYIDGKRDVLEHEEYSTLINYVFYRSTLLSDDAAIKYYNEKLYPIVEKYGNLILHIGDPERYPEIGYYPLTPYVNVYYQYDEKGNLYDAQLKLDIERFGYKPGVKVD